MMREKNIEMESYKRRRYRYFLEFESSKWMVIRRTAGTCLVVVFGDIRESLRLIYLFALKRQLAWGVAAKTCFENIAQIEQRQSTNHDVFPNNLSIIT